MALKELQRQLQETYRTGITGNSTLDANDGPAASAVTEPGRIVYEDWRDNLWYKWGGSGASDSLVRMDPLMVDTAVGVAELNEVFDPPTNPNYLGMFIGEWDTDLNIQRFYAIDNAGGGIQQVHHIDPFTPWNAASPSFTDDNFVNPLYKKQSTGSSSVNGYRSNGNQQGGLVFFESGEPGSFPAGYALQAGVSVRESGVVYDHVLAQIDLDPAGDGLATILPVPNWYDVDHGANVHPTAHTAPFAGLEVCFDSLQFTPDGDSTVAAPKGRLFFFAHNEENVAVANGDQWRDQPLTVGSVISRPMKVVEWNPTDKDATPGNISRVHLRLLLQSVMRFTEDTPVASGGIGEDEGFRWGYVKQIQYYHPPTDTIRTWWNESVTGGGVSQLAMINFALAPAIAQISTPTAEGRVETGKTIVFGATVSGDLGEPVSAVDLDWTLDRRSTKGEILSNPGAGNPVSVANFPIDGVSNTDNTLVVYEDGTPIVEGVNYTVVISTGTITGIGPVFDLTKTYTVDYGHQTNGVQPPHGNLLTQQSRTDNTGKAIARVEYAADADLAGQRDGLEPTQSS